MSLHPVSADNLRGRIALLAMDKQRCRDNGSDFVNLSELAHFSTSHYPEFQILERKMCQSSVRSTARTLKSTTPSPEPGANAYRSSRSVHWQSNKLDGGKEGTIKSTTPSPEPGVNAYLSPRSTLRSTASGIGKNRQDGSDGWGTAFGRSTSSDSSQGSTTGYFYLV